MMNWRRWFGRRKRPTAADVRYAAYERRLVETWPDIHDPASERFYFARMSGRQIKALIQAEMVTDPALREYFALERKRRLM